jgi:DNA-binding NarL/FixJ family response regulator
VSAERKPETPETKQVNQERPVRVLLADDHNLIRQSISEMLERDDGIEVVGQAPDGIEAVSLAGQTRPDVVLLDVEMPKMGAEETIVRILEESPDSKVVILTVYDDPSLMRELLTRGASAYLVKTVSSRELISTVKSAAIDDDRVVLSLSRKALDGVADSGNISSLSERELELLLFAARGMSNAQIGSHFYLTEGTVKRHLHNVYKKLGVASRAEATRKALSEGWITARDITNSTGP